MIFAFLFVGAALFACGAVVGYLIGYDQGTWYQGGRGSVTPK